MKILDLVIVAALCAAPCVVAYDGNNTTQPIFFTEDEHGNNPRQWVGVNIGGELFAMPADEFLILDALTDIDGLTMAASDAQQCGELALLLCGEGNICCFCYSGNGNQSCSFSCQDSAGDCEPCPECGPDFDAAEISYLTE